MRFEVTISSTPSSVQQDQGFLISEGCPLFPNFQTALFALVYGHTTQWDQAQQRSQQGKILIRLAQTDAWIEHIHISPISLSVQIEGSQLQGTFLQVQAPPYPPFEQTIEKSGTIECPLPDGMPRQVWIVLSREHTWLDCLTLDQRWSPFTAKKTSVSSEPPDMATQIQALISGGEGPTVEFKEDTPENKDQMLKTMAAFANDQGGVILLGVKDRTGELTGLREDAGRKKDGIQNMIRNAVVPEIQVHFEVCEIEYRTILAIYIAKGQFPPYGLNPTKPTYYVRRGATTFPARQEECRALAQSTLPPRTLLSSMLTS
jgi:Schlafen, AlbA_2